MIENNLEYEVHFTLDDDSSDVVSAIVVCNQIRTLDSGTVCFIHSGGNTVLMLSSASFKMAVLLSKDETSAYDSVSFVEEGNPIEDQEETDSITSDELEEDDLGSL